MGKRKRTEADSTCPDAGYYPGNPQKTAEGEIEKIKLYLRTKVQAESIVTTTVISHLFDLVDSEARRAIEMLLVGKFLVRSAEYGNVPIRVMFLPKE